MVYLPSTARAGRPVSKQVIAPSKLYPIYDRPSDSRLAEADRALSEIEQYIAPGSRVLISLIVRASVHRGFSVAEATWSIYERIANGDYAAYLLKDLPGSEALVSEGRPPAGLGIAEGVLHIDGGRDCPWGISAIILPKRGRAPQESTDKQGDKQSAQGNNREPSHSPDYRSVNWYGEKYTFSAMQAACVRVLWENWEQGTPVVGEQTILVTADSSSERLRDVFGKDHAAWGTLIQPSGKGAFKLTEPEES